MMRSMMSAAILALGAFAPAFAAEPTEMSAEFKAKIESLETRMWPSAPIESEDLEIVASVDRNDRNQGLDITMSDGDRSLDWPDL